MLGTFLFLVENKHALFVKHALGLYFSLEGRLYIFSTLIMKCDCHGVGRGPKPEEWGA